MKTSPKKPRLSFTEEDMEPAGSTKKALKKEKVAPDDEGYAVKISGGSMKPMPENFRAKTEGGNASEGSNGVENQDFSDDENGRSKMNTYKQDTIENLIMVKQEQDGTPGTVRKKRKYVKRKKIGIDENFSRSEMKNDGFSGEDDDDDADSDGKKSKKKNKDKSDEQLKCETCGQYGYAADFCASGRFCGQKCVGVYASRCRAQALAAASMAQGEQGKGEKPKRGKKRGRKPWKRLNLDIGEEDTFAPPKKNGYVPKMKARRKPKQPGLPCDDSTVYYSAVTAGVEFEWDVYLALTGTEAVSEDVFLTENRRRKLYPSPAGFKQGMKLESFDPRHPSCLCVMSVVEVLGPRMRLHFDGWSESYDFWTNMDSPFLFPVGWAEKNGQTLNPPRDDGFQIINILESTTETEF